MLNVALEFLIKKLAEEINVAGSPEKVSLLSLVNDRGEFIVQPGNLSLMLVHVEEERSIKSQLPREKKINDKEVQFANPEIKLNLLILLAANPGKTKAEYTMAL